MKNIRKCLNLICYPECWKFWDGSNILHIRNAKPNFFGFRNEITYLCKETGVRKQNIDIYNDINDFIVIKK